MILTIQIQAIRKPIRKTIALTLLALWLLGSASPASGAGNWSNDQDIAESTSGAITNIPLVASADGLKLFTGYEKSLPDSTYGIFIKRSLDGGITFIETQVASVSPGSFLGSGEIAISDTGQYVSLAFAVYDSSYNSTSYALRSEDYGLGWSDLDLNGASSGVALVGAGNPKVKMSSNGNVIAAAFSKSATSNSVLISQDGGLTFVAQDFYTLSTQAEIAMNSDGSLIGLVTRELAFPRYPLKFYRSTNQGTTWSPQFLTLSGENITSFGIAISKEKFSGENFVVVDYYDQNSAKNYIATSTDSGLSFPRLVDLGSDSGYGGFTNIRFDSSTTWIALSTGAYWNSYQTKVIRSTDQGQTWTFTADLPLAGNITRSGDLEIVGQATYALVSVYPDSSSFTSSVGIFSSNDFGDSWSAFTTLGTGSFDSFMYDDLSRPKLASGLSSTNVYAMWASVSGTNGKTKFNSLNTPTSTPPATPPATPASGSPQPLALALVPSEVSNSDRIVSLFGARLDGATHLMINGSRVEILSNINGKITFRAPPASAGTYDVDVVLPSQTITSAEQLVYLRNVVGPRVIVAGFATNKTTLTKSMKKEIRQHLKANPGYSTAVCKGFTSGPANAINKKLARQRGQAACDYIVKRNPDLSVRVLKGSHTNKPGSEIRRVRIILK